MALCWRDCRQSRSFEFEPYRSALQYSKRGRMKERKTACFKGCGMGTLFVLVSRCFRENVVVTNKIVSFLCSLDNILLKNVIVFFFEIKFQYGAHLKKWLLLTYFLHFFSHQGKVKQIPSAHVSLTYIHVFCSPYWLLLPYQFWKKKIRIYQVWFLFGMNPGVDSYLRHFETFNS